MGWSAGTFSRVHDWTTDEGSAIDIEAVRMDAEDDNFATGINTCLTKDGQNTPTGNLPMGTNRHTGVGDAAAKTDYASAADVIDQHLTFYVDSGSADAYVVTPSPSIGAYAEGQRLVFRATNANTGASTLNANGLGAIAIQTPEGVALTAGMIIDGGYYEVVYDANAAPDRWVLMSPTSIAERSIASQAQAEAETDNTTIMTPLRVGDWSDANGGMVGDIQALADPGDDRILAYDTSAGAVIAADIGSGLTMSGAGIISAVQSTESAVGVAELATQAEVNTGTDDTRIVTPLKLSVAVGSMRGEEKPTNETTSVDTTLSDDSDLTFSLDAGTYIVRLTFYFWATTTAAMGIKYRVNYTGTTTRSTFARIQHIAGTGTVESATGANITTQINTIGTSSSDEDYITLDGTVVVSDSGTLSLQWAQAASQGDNLNMKNGSYMSVTKIA